MKAKVVAVGGVPMPEYKPEIRLEGDQIEKYLGDFSFQKGMRYSVEMEFECTGWNKRENGTECLTLTLLEGGEAREVGKAPPPKKQKEEGEESPEVEVVKVTKTSEGY